MKPFKRATTFSFSAKEEKTKRRVTLESDKPPAASSLLSTSSNDQNADSLNIQTSEPPTRNTAGTRTHTHTLCSTAADLMR